MPPNLFRQMRHPQDPVARLKAAQALGESDELETLPLLIRAAVEDPDAQVRQAARTSLQSRIGTQADLAIQTYRADPDEDPWLVEGETDDEEEDAGDLALEDEQYLVGLVTVLRSHPGTQMRLKAIRELQKSDDMRVIAALAETVLWTDDEEVRSAARASLEARFGGDVEEIIQSYQVQDYLEEDQGDESQDASESYYGYGVEQPPPSTRVQRHYREQTTDSQPAEPVSREEGTPWLLVVIGVAGVVITVIIVLLSLR
jgi:HEAT repeat protein